MSKYHLSISHTKIKKKKQFRNSPLIRTQNYLKNEHALLPDIHTTWKTSIIFKDVYFLGMQAKVYFKIRFPPWDLSFQPISGQCSHFPPPENRKPLVFRGWKMGTLTRNELRTIRTQPTKSLSFCVKTLLWNVEIKYTK